MALLHIDFYSDVLGRGTHMDVILPEQGSGSLVRATGDDADSWFQGAVFDFSKLEDDLEAVRVGECDENYDYMIGGRFLHYDWRKNRVDWSQTSIDG